MAGPVAKPTPGTIPVFIADLHHQDGARAPVCGVSRCLFVKGSRRWRDSINLEILGGGRRLVGPKKQPGRASGLALMDFGGRLRVGRRREQDQREQALISKPRGAFADVFSEQGHKPRHWNAANGFGREHAVLLGAHRGEVSPAHAMGDATDPTMFHELSTGAALAASGRHACQCRAKGSRYRDQRHGQERD